MTSASLLVALAVIASVSGPLGAPRTITLCAATLGQTAHEIQCSFRSRTARESRCSSGEAGLPIAGARAESPSRVAVVPGDVAALAFVRERADLPPPAVAIA